MTLLAMTCLIAAGRADIQRQPGEFEPQAAVWLSAEPKNVEFMRITAELVKELAPHVKIKMLLEDANSQTEVRGFFKRKGIQASKVQYFTDKRATLFLRDGTVFTVGHRLGILDLKWSLYGLEAWCEDVYADDPAIKREFLSSLRSGDDGLDAFFASATGARPVKSPLLLENATFEVNGKGVLLISERLARKRHPSLSRVEIQRELLKMPGVRKVIWLYDGAAEDPHMMATIRDNYVGMGAGGHTDEFVRFADPHTILLSWVDHDPINAVEELNKERMERNYQILLRSTDQDGKRFRIFRVPTPKPIVRTVTLAPAADTKTRWNEILFPKREGRMAGDKVYEVAAASYLNFVVSNGVVVVPSFVEDGTPAATQSRVRQVIERAFPGRTIRFVNATPFTWSGGGPHCATLNEPLMRGR